MAMKLLITGATGFLGTALCSRLEALGHEVTRLNSKNCDLIQSGSLLNFNQINYDQIYHLAAWTQAGDFCLYHPGEQWLINQQINTNVLTWWQQYQPQAKLISMGTSCAYDPDLPLAEQNYLAGIPIDSLFTYAMTKRMLFAGHLALHKQYGLKYLCLVPSTLYGPSYHIDGRQMYFIFDLICKIIRAKLYDETVVLWGDGYQSREIVFIDDFVNIAIQLANNFDNQIINIGAGEEFSIRHFAELICKNVGYDFSSVQFDTERYVGAKSKCLEVEKLRHCIPDLSMTSLEVGLAKTIDWFWEKRTELLSDYS